MDRSKEIEEAREAMERTPDQTRLPEFSFILVKIGKKTRIINTDSSDQKVIEKTFLSNAAKYGEENVRVCKVLSTRIIRSVSFDE